MGRSLRRVKRHNRPVSRKPKKKPKTSSKVPVELASQSKVIEKRIGKSVQWDENKTLKYNYKANGFLNSVKGRSAQNPVPEEVENANKIEGDFADDDELRILMAKQRKTGKAAPQRLTSHQKQIVEKLIEAHGSDVEAMSKDRKLNSMLHSEGKLRRMLESYTHWMGKTGVDFRVPKKRLW
uniref:Nucleolar protein 16 n=1 Tax=Tetraselmis sp. GSL018 TaxID=582737 RepID=A0A061SBI4_9CHLO|mmetsp:Transcript_10081/g.24045  ORF Transcript_10081/g.24045 Transcript_10081/m.24045 type:complete len:181 (-) Transcript_10081:174-716(-)